MNAKDLKLLILKNSFVEKLRIEMKFYDDEYDELCNLLKELIAETKEDKTIDKELMLTLYATPQMVYNIFSYSSNNTTDVEFTNKLEEAWIELDRLMLELLSQ